MTKPSWVNLNINEAAEALGVSRQLLNTIAPIMAPDYAYRSGSSWLFRAEWVAHWAAFFEARSALVEAGYWKPKRKHSVQDFEDWHNGDLDDALDEVVTWK